MDKNFKKIYNEIDSVNYSVLKRETLQVMYDKITKDQLKHLEEIRKLKKEIERCLIAHDGASAIDLKVEARKIQKSYNDAEADKEKIWKVLQNRILHDNLVKQFGDAKWVSRKETFIMFLIIFVLGLLMYDIMNPGLPASTKRTLYYLDFFACIIFLSNFFYELRFADSKAWYWKSHIIDFITSIPLPDLQAMRFGRMLRLTRLTRLVRILRVLRAIAFFWRGAKHLEHLKDTKDMEMDLEQGDVQLPKVFNLKLVKGTIKYGSIILVSGAVLIYFAEQDTSTVGVETISDSMWWSFTTLLTGGFSDLHNPKSVLGKGLTAILVITGITMVSLFTAAVTSMMMSGDSDMLKEVKKDMTKLSDELKEIKNKA